MLRTLLGAGIAAGLLAVAPVGAQEVRFVTLEMREFWHPQRPEFVSIAHHAGDRSSRHQRDKQSEPAGHERSMRDGTMHRQIRHGSKAHRQPSLAPRGIVID